MSENPSGPSGSTILQKYQRAISALEPEAQLERQKKVGPKTLRRMLSAEAPDELI